jgi:UDP-N-acetyl-D-mannosaminuronate dehydrogenase
LEVINSLIKQGYEVSCVEPNITRKTDYNLIDLGDAANDYEVIAILVKHKEFGSNKIKTVLERRNALDFCGTFK